MLLDKLKALRVKMPPLEGGGDYGPQQFEWLAEAQTVVSQWNADEGRSFKHSVDMLVSRISRREHYAKVVMTIQRAIATLESSGPPDTQQVFGPGAVYDFFKALRGLVQSAKSELFVVDPYLNADIFDAYLTGIDAQVSVRLLASRYEADLRTASQRFIAQHQQQLEVRKSPSLHDRVIFIDGVQCWVLGASIKDAAKTKMTYIAPLSTDVAAVKLVYYNSQWNSAIAI